jgi:glucose/arabinose dehydrogenase
VSSAIRIPLLSTLLVVLPASLFASCGTQTGSGSHGAADAAADLTLTADTRAEVVPPPFDGPSAPTYCDLPGSLVFGSGGTTLIAGGNSAAPSLTWLTLPQGFCAHYYGHVDTTRQIRFAPGGELFVSSPATPTAGGANAGLGSIVVLTDANGDGYADGDVFAHSDGTPQTLTVFTNVASVQGLMFTPGFFYFQNGTEIMKVPYATGQSALTGTPESVIDISLANGRYVSGVHWPKTLDIADDGTIYVGNGGDQSQQCNPNVFPRPFTGGILTIDGTPGGTPVAEGFRNAIAIRCQRGHDLCFSTELALDGSKEGGGREKLVPIRTGDDWGFPCCATTNLVYSEVSGNPNCASVATEPVSFLIGDTPFGLDFETGVWPSPYTSNIVVPMHGVVGSWVGARVVAIPTQANGMPVPSSDLGSSTFTNLATGWDDGMQDHGRPAAIAFSADGRAFIANDVNGDIFWIAPSALKTKS